MQTQPNTPKQNKPRTMEAAERIQALISERSYLPGDRIPNEFELAGELGIARGTVREAIKFLISRNVLYIRRGVGTFVSDNPGLVDDPWGLHFQLNEAEIASQLLEIRLILEPEMARLAAQRATNEEIEAIKQCCKKTEDKIFSGQPHQEEDVAFHLAISNASHNIVAASILNQVFAQSIPMQATLSRNNLLKETIDTHSKVCEAIEKHNGDLAYDNMKKHIEYNQQVINKLLDK